jgi:putative transposase
MARAHRHFIPGQAWHLTHRCHKREFLLKFARDRQRWLHWLYKAKLRFGLTVLHYCVTSNHIHLLVYDAKGDGRIAKAIQLVAGRMAQEYNQRKHRKGAFWEDRYHATAIETGKHLLRCAVYIDLNMVRAGVVAHPQQWGHGGYREIQAPRRRYVLIDYGLLAHLSGYDDFHQFQAAHREWVETALIEKGRQREASWSESIAVGSQDYITGVGEALGSAASGRKVRKVAEGWELREAQMLYKADFGGQNGVIGSQNQHFWRINDMISET